MLEEIKIMTRKILVILAVLAVVLAVMVVSTEARRGGIGGSGGTGGSGGGIAPNGNYDPSSTDCGNYNGNYDSLPGNYEISDLGNYDGNYDGNYEALPAVAWVKRYDSGGKDSAKGVTTDSKDNVIVAGNVGTIKYGSTGNPFWIAPYNGNSVAIDSHDNMIVTGGSGTIKYDPRGNQIWAVSVGGAGVATDSKGNVIVTGSSNGDYLTIKYDSSGNQIWNRTYDGGGSDSARGVAIDSDDNVIVTGWSSYGGWECLNYCGGDDYLTIKYDSDGNQLWAKTWARTYSYISTFGYFASGVAVDSKDNVIVTGTSWTPDGRRYHIVKYDSFGNVLWNRTYIDSDEYSGFFDFAQGVAVDSDDNVYVTGESAVLRNYQFTNYVYLTIKYDSNGNPLWKFTYDADTIGSRSLDSARGVAVDSDGNVYVTGESSSDYFTIKLCSEESQNGVPRHMNLDKTTNSKRR